MSTETNTDSSPKNERKTKRRKVAGAIARNVGKGPLTIACPPAGLSSFGRA